MATARLRLRPPARADVPHVQRYAIREDFYRYMDMERPTPEGVAQYLEGAMAARRRPQANEFVFAIEPNDAGRLAGLVRSGIEADAANAASVGFHLDRNFQGRGYATEALRARADRHWRRRPGPNPRRSRYPQHKIVAGPGAGRVAAGTADGGLQERPGNGHGPVSVGCRPTPVQIDRRAGRAGAYPYFTFMIS